MGLLRAALANGIPTPMLISWIVASVALLVALRELLRSGGPFSVWRRSYAVAFPVLVATTVALESVSPYLRAGWFESAMFLRTVGFWGLVLVTPIAVGQVMQLRPPAWLTQAFPGLAIVHLGLWVTTDLVYGHPAGFEAAAHIGPLTLPLLLPVAALTGWWLLNTLPAAPSEIALWLLALAGSATTLGLVVSALAIDPALTDHLLVASWLPLLLATTLVTALEDWRRRAVQPG